MHEGFFGPEVRYSWNGTGKLESGDHENVLAQFGFVVTHSQLGREKIFTDYLKSTPAVQSASMPMPMPIGAHQQLYQQVNAFGSFIVSNLYIPCQTLICRFKASHC